MSFNKQSFYLDSKLAIYELPYIIFLQSTQEKTKEHLMLTFDFSEFNVLVNIV